MKNRYIAIAFCLGISFLAQSQQNAKKSIMKVLLQQESAWNNGDIPAFMAGYWQNDSLMFIGKRVVYGWEQTLENYKKSYPDTATMGKLHFDIVQVKKMSAKNYFVVGKWHLARSAKEDLGGMFTLLFERIGGKWVIVVDHTS